MTKYNYSVFIGRFQPFHKGHYRVVKKALEESEKLIVVLGSSKSPRNSRNPLTEYERVSIIRSALNEDEESRTTFTFIEDHIYNDNLWVSQVVDKVNSSIEKNSTVALIGLNKDESSYYLSKFPMWESIRYTTDEEILSATDIREKAFWENDLEIFSVSSNHTKSIYSNLKKAFNSLNNELFHEKNYESTWGKGPHKTVDSIVESSSHILMIKRGSEYCHNQWALPGGFIDTNETVLQATVRELREETKLKIPEKVLRGSIQGVHEFDSPHRDLRSRIITTVTHFKLEDRIKLPKVIGSDDAIDAKWFPISSLKDMRKDIFADHASIIEYMLRIQI